MTIKEYILSKPDDYKYEIDYIFNNFCPVCKKYIDEYDLEYSTIEIGTTANFKEDIKGERRSHYSDYDFVYNDFDIDECMLSEGDKGQEVITINKVGDDEVCSECEEKQRYEENE